MASVTVPLRVGCAPEVARHLSTPRVGGSVRPGAIPAVLGLFAFCGPPIIYPASCRCVLPSKSGFRRPRTGRAMRAPCSSATWSRRLIGLADVGRELLQLVFGFNGFEDVEKTFLVLFGEVGGLEHPLSESTGGHREGSALGIVDE